MSLRLGRAGAASIAAAVTVPTVPGAPTAFAAVGQNGQVHLTWGAAAAHGSPVTDYQIKAFQGGTLYGTDDLGNAGLQTTFPGLTNGTPYTFEIRAVNAIGTGPAATAGPVSPTSVVQPDPPAAPYFTPGYSVDSHQATIGWYGPNDPNVSPAAPITFHRVQARVAGGDGTVVSTAYFTDTSSPNTNYATVTGLTNGTIYNFVVQATSRSDQTDDAGYGPSLAVNGITVDAKNASAGGSPETAFTLTDVSDMRNGLDLAQFLTGAAYDQGNFTSPSLRGVWFKFLPADLDIIQSFTLTVPGGSTTAPAVAIFDADHVPQPGTVDTVYDSSVYEGIDPLVLRYSENNGNEVLQELYAVIYSTAAILSTDTDKLVNLNAQVNRTTSEPGGYISSNVTAAEGSLTMTWVDIPDAHDSGSPVLDYLVQCPGQTGRTIAQGVQTATFTGLTDATFITLTITARNAVGMGLRQTRSGTVGTPPTVSGLTATSGETGKSTVSWTPVPGTDGAISFYSVTTTPATYDHQVYPPDTGEVVTGLTNLTLTTITVMARGGNGVGTAVSTTCTPGATVPGAPTGVGASPGDTQASVTWAAPASDGGSAITGYVITSSPATSPVTVGNVLVGTVTGLTNGTAYTFTVHAVNAVGSSAESAASSAVTPVH